MKHLHQRHVGNSSFLKRLNRSSVLQLLRLHGGLSRKQLTGLTQLDGKTITNVTNDLLKLGAVKAMGKISRGAGRPSEILDLNPGYGYAIGIDLGGNHVACAAVDFSGAITARTYSKIQYGISPNSVVKRMIAAGKRVQEKLPGNHKRLLGIGLCVPGTVGRETGTGIWAANLADWRNIPLRNPFEEAFQTTMLLEESTRCAALGEMFARVRENLTDFLLLDVSLGIGSAIVQNGRIYHGHSGIAGEIGHTTMKPDGHPCRCGKLGCLESEASGYAIARKYAEIQTRGKKNNRNSGGQCDPGKVSAKEVAEAALQGNEICRNLFRDTGKMLGTAAANAVMLLNPANLILMGGLTRAGDLLLHPFRETLRKELMPEILETLKVEISPLGDDGGPLGAASMVLSRIYDTAGNIDG